MNFKTKTINFPKIFCDKFLEINKRNTDILIIKIQLLKKDISDELLKEIEEKRIIVSIKLTNHENYTEIASNNKKNIEFYIINCISIYFKIKKPDSTNNDNNLKEIYKYFSISNNRSLFRNFSSLKITTLSNKTIAEYQIFLKDYTYDYLVIFMKPINYFNKQNHINSSLKEKKKSIDVENIINSNNFSEISKSIYYNKSRLYDLENEKTGLLVNPVH